MAATYKTEGIILRRQNFRDADRLVVIFTKQYGKLTARVISARRLQSKLAGHIEPFMETDLFFAVSRTIDIVAGSVTRVAHCSVREDVNRHAAMNVFSEVLDRLTPDRQRDNGIYDVLHAYLRWLSNHSHHLFVLHAAILEFLARAGYAITAERCHTCHQSLRYEQAIFQFSISSLLCSSCANSNQDISLSTEAVALLRLLRVRPWADIFVIPIHTKVYEEWNCFMERLLEYHIGAPLRSMRSAVSVWSTKSYGVSKDSSQVPILQYPSSPML